jgi:hypothetical protein
MVRNFCGSLIPEKKGRNLKSASKMGAVKADEIPVARIKLTMPAVAMPLPIHFSEDLLRNEMKPFTARYRMNTKTNCHPGNV